MAANRKSSIDNQYAKKAQSHTSSIDQVNVTNEKTSKIQKKVEVNVPENFIIACIPTFNEQDTIGAVILNASKYVDKVFICDDGSTDFTAEISKGVGAFVQKHEFRKGLRETLRDLCKVSIETRAATIVVMEGDNLDYPSLITDFITPIKNGVTDVVFGTYGGDQPEAYTNIIKAFSGQALSKFYDFNELGNVTEELAYAERVGLRVKVLPTNIEADEAPSPLIEEPMNQKADNEPVKKPIPTSLLEIITIDKPLQVFGLLSMIFMAIGLLSGFFILSEYLNNSYFSVPLALVFISSIVIWGVFVIAALVLHTFSKRG